MPAEISLLIADLSASELNKRIAAAEQLAHRADAQAAAIPLVRATGDPNEQVREFATSALEDLGKPAIDDIPALVELLSSSSADVGYWSATLLGRTAEQAATAVEPLSSAMLGSDAPSVRQRAAWALGEIGPAAAQVKPALEQAAASDDRRLARFASHALKRM